MCRIDLGFPKFRVKFRVRWKMLTIARCDSSRGQPDAKPEPSLPRALFVRTPPNDV